MNILSYKAEQDGRWIKLSCNDGRLQVTFNNYQDAIEYLMKPCDFAVVWNVDKFAEMFCSLLPSNIVKDLKEHGKAYLPMPYRQKLYYQAGRVFAITWGAGREVNFYPLSRYADNEPADATELSLLADKVMKAYQYFGIIPTKLTSPVAVYGEFLDKLDFPRACDLPDNALPMLDKCSGVDWREWREVYKLGHWESNGITDYDLTAAYPYLISLLPDISKARYFTSNTMPNKYSWGLLQGKLKITKDVTPFLHMGEWDDFITTEHLWLIRKYNLGDFELDTGWFYVFPSIHYKSPFNKLMMELYHARHNDNGLVAKIAKAISVGVGGKFAQRYDDGRLGDNWNSIYACMITSRCQIKVADFIHRHNLANRVVSVMVDGCLVEGKRVSLQNNKNMGYWRANNQSPFLVASLLYQWGNDKIPDGHTYDEIMSLIQTKPKQSIYGNIDLNLLTYNRTFPNLPKSGGDLLGNIYNSIPTRMP